MKSKATSPLATDNLLARAKLLPIPQTGVMITVPLDILPAYLQLHGLDCKQYDHRKRLMVVERTK